MTGTILNGSVKVNDNIEIPLLKTQKKVKSIQVFRKPVEKAIQGDRCGICLTNFDSKQFERGIVCAPSYVKTSYAVIIKLNKIKHFKGSIQSGSKFHITINHETHLAKIELFGGFGDELIDKNADSSFDFTKEYLYVDEYAPDDAKKVEDSEASAKTNKKIVNYYALIDFTFENASDIASSGVLCVANSLLIGSKLGKYPFLSYDRICNIKPILYKN
jgi:selenocysteine-specific elongation factor